MMAMTSFFANVIACGILFSGIARPATGSGTTTADLERYVRAVMECRNVTGLALALVKGNETVYTGGFGLRDLDNQLPLLDTTLLNIGSETKAFTSTLAADAVGRKLMTWDEPIKKVFPAGFRLQNSFRTDKASLRDFLSHRLGMPSYWGVSTAVMNLTIDEIAERLKDFPVKYQFREKFYYSNYLFVVAAAAIQRATGETWQDAMYSKIFQPLGMNGSRVSTTLTEADWDNMAYSNTIINNKHVQNAEKEMLPIAKELNPAGGVFTNAVDMSKWIKFHLSGGKDSSGKQLIPWLVFKNVYYPVVSTGQSGITRMNYPVDDLTFSYALAWFKGVYDGYPMNHHTGEYSSYSAKLTFLPTADVGVWVGITGSKEGVGSEVRDTITMYALDLLLGKTPWLNSSSACSYPEPFGRHRKSAPRPQAEDRTTKSSNPVHTSAYVGDYAHPAFGTFHVTRTGNQLRYAFGLLLRGNLNPNSGDEFYQTLDYPLSYRMPSFPEYPNGFPISFFRNGQGSITSIKIPYLEFDQPPVFVKR